MKTTHLLLLASLLTLSGCGLAGESYPTPIPADVLPTAIYQTALAANATMFALTPSVTPTPLPTFTPTPTATFTPTITLTPTGIPPAPRAGIFVAAPGPMSKVASPLQLRMEVVAGDSQMVDIRLFGEDGRQIAGKLERVLAEAPVPAYVTLKIPFEVRTAELARLQVATTYRGGGIASLTTTMILLLPVGPSEITPAPPPFERAAFYVPEPKTEISGGILNIEGAMWPFNNGQPVILEVVEETGKIITEKILNLEGDTYMPFAVAIPYEVFALTPARLVIRQSDKDGNYLYLHSQAITLNP
jgi:hypothetical protein